MRRAFAGALLSLLVAFPIAANACQCSDLLTEGLYRPRTMRQWDEARVAISVRFSNEETIFEGTVEKQDIVSAPAAPDNRGRPSEYKNRLVTIRASRVYRGPGEERFVVLTGMGGGDCGFDFETGEQYLVFAEQDGKNLTTNICTGTNSLQDSGSMLRVLRGEAPAPEDLLDRDAYYNRFRDPARWGRICGLVTSSHGVPVGNCWVNLVRKRHDGMPPRRNTEFSHPDGTYCFEFLRSGTYFLSGEDYDPATKIRRAGSLLENGHPLPISVQGGKTVGNMNLVLHEDSRDWARRHAFLGIVIAVSATLALIAFWLARGRTRLAS